MSRAKNKPAEPPRPTYALVSLGCPKNLVDSERMLRAAATGRLRMVRRPGGADFVVVNTCGFIDDAREESYATIHEMLDLQAAGPGSRGDRGRLPGRARQGEAAAKSTPTSTSSSAFSAAMRSRRPPTG